MGMAARVQRGFSLLEIAIVLVVISILLAAVAVPLAGQLDQQRTNETNRQLEVAKEALIGFAQSNGRLPCPSTTIKKGRESVIDPVQGTCDAYVGLLPAVTLGLSPLDDDGFAVDAWSGSVNRIRYAVADINTAGGADCAITRQHALTRRNGIRDVGTTCLNNAANEATFTWLKVCAVRPNGAAGAATACTSVLNGMAPFVVYSVGKNATNATPGADEAHNLDADRFLVSHAPAAATSPTGEFDDLVTWGSLSTLFARMERSGALP
jgi:prepilin-type N-terminal cleavage/methylation domain-containing protein